MSRSTLVDRLADAMRRELRANAWKGDNWHHQPIARLSEDVLYHAAKLDLALRANDLEAVKELAADIANCAAIAADAVGALDVQLPDVVGDQDYDADEIANGGMRYGGEPLKTHVAAWRDTLTRDEFRRGPRALPEAA